MNKFRSFLLATTVVIFSATFALAGDIQGPGKSDPTPLTNTSTSDGQPQPTSEEMQIEWQDATTMLVEILLTIF